MEKKLQASIRHHQRFGERESFANKASQTLPKRIIPAFHMSRFPGFLSDRGVLLLWDHRLIRCPEIREAVTCTLAIWNGLPQTLTRLAGFDLQLRKPPLDASCGTGPSTSWSRALL
jgi:hypothetical protein